MFNLSFVKFQRAQINSGALTNKKLNFDLKAFAILVFFDITFLRIYFFGFYT